MCEWFFRCPHRAVLSIDISLCDKNGHLLSAKYSIVIHCSHQQKQEILEQKCDLLAGQQESSPRHGQQNMILLKILCIVLTEISKEWATLLLRYVCTLPLVFFCNAVVTSSTDFTSKEHILQISYSFLSDPWQTS